MSAEKESESSSSGGTAVAEPKEKTDKQPRRQPPYNVVLLDDNAHTYDYVIEMLGRLFGYEKVKAFNLACEVDYVGRAIVLTTTKEHAEFKRDQIHAFGPDHRMEHCEGSMSAIIEPAETPGE